MSRSPDVVHDRLQLAVQAGCLARISGLIRQVHVAVAVNRDPVVGLRDVLSCQPEVGCVP